MMMLDFASKGEDKIVCRQTRKERSLNLRLKSQVLFLLILYNIDPDLNNNNLTIPKRFIRNIILFAIVYLFSNGC